MQETLNYQVTYGAQTPAPRPDPDAPLFASEDGRVASLSSQECIFQVKRSGDTHVMTFQVLQAMDQCREFRSLDEHAARIESTIAGLAGKQADIRRVLDGLVQRGLLVSDRIFIERLTNVPAITPQDLRAVFIRACDRPQQLHHLLGSLSSYERDYRAARRYVVLDDSSLPAHMNEQRDALREFARTTGCKVTYIGSAESAKIVGKLSRAQPQAKLALSRALLRDSDARAARFGGGRGWNMALLLSAGARLAMLDDDLRLPLRRPEFARDGMDPNPNAQALARFPSSMENALAWGEPVAQDPFELHLQGCGQMLGALSHERYPLDRRALRGLNLGRLAEFNADSRILATQTGTCGSSRTETGLWLYQLDAESRAEFWRERSAYQANVDAQHLCHAVAQARVSTMTNFTPFTLDNSDLLPCTNPVGRGEDGLAGALMRYCHPHSVMLELPEAIGHVQEIARKRSDKTMAAYEPRVNHFLRDYVQRQFGAFHAADTGQRMSSMADVLRDLAAASVDDRISHLREYLSYIRADIIDRLQHQIEAAPDAPVYWQADARAIVQANARALLAKSPPRLGDWVADIDEAGCATALATELNDFADICEHWPALWQHAAEQGEKLLSGV
ncbi:MAG: hypothetical protein WBV39_10515 [Rudaea sp.]